MHTKTAQFRLCACISTILVVTALASVHAQTRKQPKRAPRATAPRAVKAAPPAALPCGDYVGFQVLLDRQGISTGQIDGKPGANFKNALSAAQAAKKVPVTGKADCATWRALGGDKGDQTIVAYTISDADMKGPFIEDIPRELPEQAKLPALGYKSALEKMAERFHASPDLLQKLNPDVPFTAGSTIKVPNVQPFDASAPKPAPDAAAADLTVQVRRDDSSMRVSRADGSLVFYAPVTTGSEHDPLPTGDYKVTSVDWNPVFHYNPDLFWDAKATDTRATLKPGPNNPVGIVWIGVSLEHYGMHGTPEPGNVGHTESHGCVRLTNWDAARLAALVKPGMPVLFR